MPPKRKYNNTRRKVAKKYGATPKRANTAASTIQAAVRRALYKNAETKHAQTSGSDYRQIEHNSFINLDSAILYTEQGVTDPSANSFYTRIGDEISLIKVDFAMMLELNERFSDCTYRIMLVKSARGDTPTLATLYNGLSGNKMLDTLNYERYSVIYQKWGKIKAPNMSIWSPGDMGGTTAPAGVYVSSSNASANFLSRSTKIVKFSIPGSKFAKNGKIIYDGQGTAAKFFDYNLLIFAYANYSTIAPTALTAGYNVLAVNDYYHRLSYKDM